MSNAFSSRNTAIAFGPEDNSPLRARLKQAFDNFVDVRGKSDAEVAALLRSREIDMATIVTSAASRIITVQEAPSIITIIPAAEIVQKLTAQGVEARRIYPYTIADQAKGAIEFGPLTYSRALTPFVVSLPLYYGMTPETVERCVKAYVEAVK